MPTAPAHRAVERFMRHYFLHAKTVGDLTGVFLAHLDEKFARQRPPLRPARLAPPPAASSKASCSIAAGSPFRTTISSREDPVRLIQHVRARRSRTGSKSTRWRCAPPAARRQADRRRGARRSARQRPVPRRADQPARSRDGAALDERGGRVRPLRSRFRPRRRPDAVRHVPSLYGRRAFDPGDRPALADRARRC